MFVCVQRAAPTRRVSAMRAASVGATQPSTDKLKVQTHIFYDFTDPCVYHVANIHFCEAFCNCISVSRQVLVIHTVHTAKVKLLHT